MTDSNNWKEFDNRALSHSSEHHLLAIRQLRESRGYARTIDIANHLNITRGSVSITLGKLEQKGYVQPDENKFYQLTKSGQAVVDNLRRKHSILRQFFTEVLQADTSDAEEEACKLEHLLSDTLAQYMQDFLHFYTSENEEAIRFRFSFKRARSRNT